MSSPSASSYAVAAGRQPLLSIRELSVDYVTEHGTVRAVDQLSIHIGKGEVFGLAGESGSGKSTAAMAALRLLQPPAIISGGEVIFDGIDVLSLSEEQLRAFRWSKVAIVFQSAMNALSPVLTVGAQIVDVIVAHERISRHHAWERAAVLIGRVGMQRARLESYPHQLSGGMRQRAVIAIALALSPPLLIMDEPTTALDVVVQKEILQQLSELKDELGFSILFITHDLSLMLEVCDTVGVLYAGRLCEVAPAKTLLSRPQHPYTQGLMGSFPSVSAARGRLFGIPGAPPDMHAPPAGCRFHPRCSQASAECELGTPVLMALAPRHVAACFHAAPYVGVSSSTPPSVRESVPLIQDASGEDSGDRQTAPDLFVAAWAPPSSGQESVSTARPPHAVLIDPRELETGAPPVSAQASALSAADRAFAAGGDEPT